MVKGELPALHLDPETRRALRTGATGWPSTTLTTMSRPQSASRAKVWARTACGRSRRDLAYSVAWADAVAGQPPPWPATGALALKFVAHQRRAAEE
jgi:hypothetical protein